MTKESDSFEIELYQCKTEECLKFTFKGKFSEQSALSGSEEWRDLFSSTGTEKSVLVWDCKEMTGFEPKARIVWQQAMKELKGQIDCVWLISNSAIIRAGAKLMSTFTGFKIKAVKTEKDIKFG